MPVLMNFLVSGLKGGKGETRACSLPHLFGDNLPPYASCPSILAVDAMRPTQVATLALEPRHAQRCVREELVCVRRAPPLPSLLPGT